MKGDLVEIRGLTAADRPWLDAVLGEHFGSSRVVSRGRMHDALALPGFVAVHDGSPLGVAVFAIEAGECEIVALVVEAPRQGIGRALVDTVVSRARRESCSRAWVVTTNDNAGAQRFYRALGWRLAAVHAGAVAKSRQLKPEIPHFGEGGVPIDDELEFDLRLVGA